MLPTELEVVTLHWLDRPALEGLQIHSRHLRDLVNRHAHALALRHIYSVTALDGDVHIQLTEDDHGIGSTQPAEYVEDIFHRLNNAFIRQLTLNFRRENLHLPRYLLANANELHCHTGSVHIEVREEAEIDYALVDFLGDRLKPKNLETSMWAPSVDYAMLFTRSAFRGKVPHVKFELYGPPAPDCIIPGLIGADVVETCAITTDVDPRPWIGKFIENFKTTERGMDITRSVTLLHTRYGNRAPLQQSVEPLGRPRCTDIPTPQNAFIKEWTRDQVLIHEIPTSESSSAELFVFENAASAQKLEVFMWSVEQVKKRPKSLHYAFFLRVASKQSCCH